MKLRLTTHLVFLSLANISCGNGEISTSADAAADVNAETSDNDVSDASCAYAACDGWTTCAVGSVCPVGDGCNYCGCMRDGDGGWQASCSLRNCTCPKLCHYLNEPCTQPSDCCSHVCSMTGNQDAGTCQ